jgi:hypothetical protein
MSDRFLASLFCCALAVGASAQQSTPIPPNASAPAKAANAADSAALEAKGHDYSQESFVIEQMHSRYRFEADGTGRKETVARIRVKAKPAFSSGDSCRKATTPPTSGSRFPTSVC